ncbi:MAG: CBS domain-containing protein [Actinomycetota bacterium]|jgi:CBS domain-containing protein|nr:CBS domain-containing protein [Actinomycetota bacterium]
MSQAITEVMTPDPVTVAATATVAEAARLMRDENIGNVVVTEDYQVCGIVTDRDITIRAVATGQDPVRTKVRDICSGDLTYLGVDDTVEDAIRTMREKALRRVPVVQDGQAVGIVSLGDLAVERDESSVLADISAAPGNP